MPEIRSVGEYETVTRREFTAQSVLTLLSGFIITVSEACGSSSSSTNPTPTTTTTPSTTPATPADINGTVSANHGHVAIVTGAEITADVAVTLNIQGTATHNHTVAIAAGDLTNLKNRQAVSITSSTDAGHQHTVTFTPV